MYNISLEGKIALVTGAGRGIGKAVAIGLAEAGADLAIVSRSERELKETAAEIERLGRRVCTFAVDVGDVQAAVGMVGDVIAHYGKIDILANVAGTLIASAAVDITEADWDKVMGINVKGAFFIAQAVGRHMIEKGIKGSIINTTSECQDQAEKDLGAYCPSKGALKMVTRVLAAEWGKHGIRVNNLAPCFIHTKINEPLIEGATPGLKTFYQAKLARVPMGRYGEPEDIVAAAVYLASDLAGYVSGTTILIDGAYTSC